MVRVKFAAVAAADGLVIRAQSTPLPSVNAPVDAIFEYGLTAAALGLLFYMIRMVLSGDLISKSNIAPVVTQSVKEAIDDYTQDLGLLTKKDMHDVVHTAVSEALAHYAKGSSA